MRTLCVIFLMLAAPLAQAADPVGRIFFTPEQRAQLDNLRTQKAVASRVRDEPVPETVTYNGIVRRSDGKATIWINNEALSETDLRNRQSMIGRIGRDGRISLQSPAVELKVGQSATTFSGKVDESFASPKITGDKDKPPKKAETSQKPALDAASSTNKDLPPELIEALRQSAVRAREKTAPPAAPGPGTAEDRKPEEQLKTSPR